jgi:hypothetical protein
VFLFVPFYLMALMIAGAQILDSRHKNRSGGQRPSPPGPGAGGPHRTTPGRAGQSRQINQAKRRPGGHTHAIGYATAPDH